MTSNNLDLTYRDVRVILALIDSWEEGRIHFVQGDFSVDAWVTTEPLKRTPARDNARKISVKSPAIGVFHRHHEGVGDVQELAEDGVIGSITAPGRVTSVIAGVEGQLVKFLVNDGEFVEYGQPVAIVDSTDG